MRAGAANDESSERPFNLEVRFLSLFKVQGVWYFANGAFGGVSWWPEA